MDKRKKEIIIVAILLPILLFVFAHSARKISGRNRNDVVEPDESFQETLENCGTEVSEQWGKMRSEQLALEQRYLEQGFSRDPFLETGNEQFWSYG